MTSEEKFVKKFEISCRNVTKIAIKETPRIATIMAYSVAVAASSSFHNLFKSFITIPSHMRTNLIVQPDCVPGSPGAQAFPLKQPLVLQTQCHRRWRTLHGGGLICVCTSTTQGTMTHMTAQDLKDSCTFFCQRVPLGRRQECPPNGIKSTRTKAPLSQHHAPAIRDLCLPVRQKATRET